MECTRVVLVLGVERRWMIKGDRLDIIEEDEVIVDEIEREAEAASSWKG